MLRHHLLLLFRNFKRFKSTFFINLIGLSTGLACSLFIYLWVNDELSIDNFHAKKDRIFYAMEHRVKADGIWTSLNTSGPLSAALREDMPEVEYAVASTRPQPYTLTLGENNMKINGRYVEPDFFRIFSYKIISGDENKLLHGTKSIVISESLALKLFNTTHDVLGKTIELDHKDEFTVSGIFKDVPSNSSEQFEFVLPYEKYLENNTWLSWGNTNLATYVLLKKGTDVDAFNKKIADYVVVKSNDKTKAYRTLFLKKYADLYLYGKYENGVLVGGRITYVKLFSIIAVFILLIACINFMNLSTAKASRRIKEVGIKKAIGASRKTLIRQYLAESMFMSFLSMTVAILIVDLLLGQFNIITGKQLQLHFDANLLLIVLSICLITGILAGSYPALYLSGFNPATVLKGKLNTSLGELWARKGLVVFQFALSAILIVSVIVVYRQIEFIQHANLGYNKDNVLFFYREGKLWEPQQLETFLQQVKNIPGVKKASSISHNMAGHNGGTWGITWEGKNPEDRTEFENVTVNHDMMEALGIEIAKGRGFTNAPGDSSKIIISETGIKFMGLKDPIGAKVTLWGQDMQIIGIAKDFHYESLHEELKPVFFRISPNDTYIIMVKLSGEDPKKSIAAIQDLYQKTNPGFIFDYQFLDTQYQELYATEQRVSVLSKYFASLAVLISCLGLFGLASFTAERRLKEIGIRKVLGATEIGIVLLLSKEFTRIVTIAILIALPISYFMTRSWLDSFAFKINLAWWYFALAGGLAFVITWLTVGIHAFKAAGVNPSKCLKDD